METIVVHITKAYKKLYVETYQKGEDAASRPYDEVDISDEDIQRLCDEISELYERASRRGGLSLDELDSFETHAKALYDQLISPRGREAISASQAKNILFFIDENLVHIPWELLHDGDEFLCLKYSVGRNVRTSQVFHKIKYRSSPGSLKMLVLADPTEDLEAAYREGESIEKQIDRNRSKIRVTLKTTGVNRIYLVKNIRDYDIVHFAGHSEYDTESPREGGWVLSDGRFAPKDVHSLGGATASFPKLVFSNACRSAKTKEWSDRTGVESEVYGMANAFILVGVKHYIGTFSRVLDESCLLFSGEFYRHLLKGVPVGEAIRLSRLKLIEKFGKISMIWSSYVLYGDPSEVLFEHNSPGENIKERVFHGGKTTLKFVGKFTMDSANMALSGIEKWTPKVVKGARVTGKGAKYVLDKGLMSLDKVSRLKRGKLSDDSVRKLNMLLSRADHSDLYGLAKILDAKRVSPGAILTALAINAQDLFGSVMGAERSYRDILKMAAKKLKIKGAENDREEEVEIKIAQKVLRTLWDNMTPDQRSKMEEELKKTSQQYDKTGSLLTSASIFGALTAAQLSGFGVYLLATTTLGAITGVAGVTLPFAVYTTMTSSIAIIIGPVGWIGAGFFAIWKLTGRNFKRLIPAILYICALRTRQYAFLPMPPEPHSDC